MSGASSCGDEVLPVTMSKRRALLIGSAVAVATGPIAVPLLRAERRAQSRSENGSDAAIDVHIELQAQPDQITIRPGKKSHVWRYRSRLLHGERGVLEEAEAPFLCPIIRVRRGQRVRIDLVNGLPESTVIHWHGLHVPAEMDGHPRYAIGPGERYRYEFTVMNRAGSYWFHPHPHGRTGKQVYFGLAGLFIVSDEEEARAGLPGGDYDKALVIQDRSFDADNRLTYLSGSLADSTAAEPQRRGMMGGGMMGGGMTGDGMMGGGMGSMMARMMGVFGDEILVNGKPKATLDVERRAYRLRLVNASNSRIYKLGWSDGTRLTVIASDGGLLATPLVRDYVMLAPAERVDLWVDFAHWRPGTELALRSLPFETGSPMSAMMSGGALPDGAAFAVLAVRIGDDPAKPSELVEQLAATPQPDPGSAINADRPKTFDLTMRMMAWGINGQGFDMLAASPLETVKLSTHEIWEFRNDGRSAMMNMTMPHSMHVHGLQFRILERSTPRADAGYYDSVSAGFVDTGWKDTLLIMPGERVRILLGFEDYAGLFLYHCHMLEHEDSGLMRNYLVEA